MRLTRGTRRALRALMYLAANGDGLATVREVADCCRISRSRLNMVVWELGRAGLVETVQGRNGGLRLARPAESITVGAAVRCMERAIPLAECFPGGAGRCRIAPACRYRTVLAEAGEAFFTVLDGYSVQDLVDGNPELSGLVPADPT